MILRVIDTGANNGFYNMALDEALLISLKNGAPTTLRFYTFSPPAITIGRFQSIDDVKGYKVDIVRRITGGRAVFHSGDLTYSLVAHADDPFFGGSVVEGYKMMSLIFKDALIALGVNAEVVHNTSAKYQRSPDCFGSTARYELSVNGNKILGSAQRIKDGALLQQGSLILNSNFEWEQVGLNQLVGRELKIEELISAVKESIKSIGIETIDGVLTSVEKELADKLIPNYLLLTTDYYKHG